jgi:FkbM family methyltransferase
VELISRELMPPRIQASRRRFVLSSNLAIRSARALAASILRRFDVVVPVHLRTGEVLFVDLANVVGRTIWFFRDYEPERAVIRLIESNLGPGDVFLDVGANVGFFSLTASRRVDLSGQVHSFEPLPSVAALLRRTVAANALTNVRIVEAAVGAGAGTATMAVMKDSAYSHVLEPTTEVETNHGTWHALAVTSISLDQYVDEALSAPPRLVKLDIEGAEVAALEGARLLLSNPAGPDVICEVYARHLFRFNHTPKDVFDIFLSHGYDALDPETLQPMGVRELSEERYNVFFRKSTRKGPTTGNIVSQSATECGSSALSKGLQ